MVEQGDEVQSELTRHGSSRSGAAVCGFWLRPGDIRPPLPTWLAFTSLYSFHDQLLVYSPNMNRITEHFFPIFAD